MRPLLLLIVAAACGEDATSREPPEGNAQVGGNVIGTVDGHPIEIDSVVSLARSAELEPREALERRQAEELLALEAYRRGYAERSEPELRARQRLVRSLIDRIAERAPLESISDEDVRARFARRRGELARPERRAIRHIVVRVDADATEERWAEAERLALRLRGEWLTDSSAYTRYREVEALESFPLHAEASALMARGNLESVLEEAVFRAEGEGILPEAYRSSGGWHVIEVSRIDVPDPPTIDEFVEQMRQEIADERRQQLLFEVAEEAAERFGVQVDEVVAARALERELP